MDAPSTVSAQIYLACAERRLYKLHDMQNVAGAVAEDAVHLLFKVFERIIRNKSQSRAGKSAAVNADSAFSVQNLFAYSQRDRHILMN